MKVRLSTWLFSAIRPYSFSVEEVRAIPNQNTGCLGGYVGGVRTGSQRTPDRLVAEAREAYEKATESPGIGARACTPRLSRKLLGHATIFITLDIYSHLPPEMGTRSRT
jgi:hypothetical protein